MPDAKDLYGIKQASKTKPKDISSAPALAFSSNLSSLISKASTSKSSSATSTSVPSANNKSKSCIFTAHHKSSKKRSAAEAFDQDGRKHQTKHDIGSVERDELEKSRRKMQEKVRLYNAMKRGEYLGRSDYDDRGLVDFDKKWADRQRSGRHGDDPSDEGSDSDDSEDSHGQEVVSYMDEFGRPRTGTRREAEKAQREQDLQTAIVAEEEQTSAYPTMPAAGIIYGDTIQHQAYDPDALLKERIASLAAKRDRSATPPPVTHFDHKAEVRTKGTGFYAFATNDEKERKRQMDALEKERQNTERIRKEKEEEKSRKAREAEEERKRLEKLRVEERTNQFLQGLDLDFSSGRNPG